jgi:hypothetical protein
VRHPGQSGQALFFFHFLLVSTVSLIRSQSLSVLSNGLSPTSPAELVKDRTMKSKRIILERKLAELNRFKQFLRREDREVFEDLVSECRRYAAGGEVFASPLKEMSLLFWMIFAQHKRLTELEKRVNAIPN